MRPKQQKKPSALKREHPALQNLKFLNFLYFFGSDLPSWIRIQILYLDPATDPLIESRSSPDPTHCLLDLKKFPSRNWLIQTGYCWLCDLTVELNKEIGTGIDYKTMLELSQVWKIRNHNKTKPLVLTYLLIICLLFTLFKNVIWPELSKNIFLNRERIYFWKYWSAKILFWSSLSVALWCSDQLLRTQNF
jgi:hypothetical protein